MAGDYPSVVAQRLSMLPAGHWRAAARVSSMVNFRRADASPAPLGTRLRCDCAVTSAVRGGVPEHLGIPTALKTQPLRPNWTGLNWQPSGSTPVSATIHPP